MMPTIEELADQNDIMNDSYQHYYSVRSGGVNHSVAGSQYPPSDFFS